MQLIRIATQVPKLTPWGEMFFFDCEDDLHHSGRIKTIGETTIEVDFGDMISEVEIASLHVYFNTHHGEEQIVTLQRGKILESY